MCGIAFAQDFSGAPVNNGIMQVFDNQRKRGTSGFGLFDGQYKHIVKATKEEAILKWLVKYDSSTILFHHREPTSTINVKKAAHPFSTKKYFGDSQYILVHNGHISNAWALQDKHEKLGIKYQSFVKGGKFNDSESLLWEMALYLEGRQDDMDAVGGIAFVCIKMVKGQLDKLYFGRNSSRPLNLYRDKYGIALSSEGPGKSIDSQRLYTYNYKAKRLTDRGFFMATYEYPAYTAPLASPKAGTAGDWLPTKTRSRYQRWIDDIDDGYAYDRQKQLYLPSGQESGATDMDSEYYQSLIDADWEEEVEMYNPSNEEVERRALDYLCQQAGNFEKAYLVVEDRYMQMAEDIETPEEFRECKLLEEVLQYFDSEPEYVDKDSVSSLWLAIWAPVDGSETMPVF